MKYLFLLVSIIITYSLSAQLFVNCPVDNTCNSVASAIISNTSADQDSICIAGIISVLASAGFNMQVVPAYSNNIHERIFMTVSNATSGATLIPNMKHTIYSAMCSSSSIIVYIA